MTKKEYETYINMLMAQGRKLYAIKLMKEASGFTIDLLGCKEHMDIVFGFFKQDLTIFSINSYPDIYSRKFMNKMRKFKFNVENLHFFNEDGNLVVTYR